VKKIDEIWAFVSVDPVLQEEGIAGLQTDRGTFPLVFSSYESMTKFMPDAQQLADDAGITILVKRYTTTGVVHVVKSERH